MEFVVPLGNFPEKVKFTPQELTFLMITGLHLFNDIGPFDDIHNSLIEIFELYRTKRTAPTDGLPASMQGTRGTAVLKREDKARIARRAAELNAFDRRNGSEDATG